MNKTVNIIIIILLSIITIFVTGLFVYLMCGNSLNFKFEFNNYSTNKVETKEFDLVDDININANLSDVLIEKSDTNKIIVELYSDNNIDHSINVDNKKVDINFYDNNVFNIFKKKNRVLVKLPEDYKDKLNINVTTGDVKIKSFKNLKSNIIVQTGDIIAELLDEAIIDSKTGDIKIDNINKINCNNTTGDIKINMINDAFINSKTGDVKINELNNSSDITVITGDVKVSNATINEDSFIKVTTGDVKIASYSGAFIETSNNIGDVKINNNNRNHEKTLKITSNIGDIKIN